MMNRVWLKSSSFPLGVRTFTFKPTPSNSSAFEKITSDAGLRRPAFFFAGGGGPKRVLSLTAVIGVSLGTVYGIYSSVKINKKTQLANAANSSAFLFLPADVKLPPATRRVVHPATDKSEGIKLTLYQYATCPFCCKARAFLDFSGVSYDVVEVNSVTRRQLDWSTTYKKVPIVVAEDLASQQLVQLNDSTMIISVLQGYFQNRNKDKENNRSLADYASCYPQLRYLDGKGKEKADVANKYFVMPNGDAKLDKDQAEGNRTKEERQWRMWVDEVYVHTLSPNVYRSPGESLQAFRWFDQVGEWEKHFSRLERWAVVHVGAAVMWMVGKRLRKRHGLQEDVRQALYDETNKWLRAIKKNGTTFMGGNTQPNLADLAIYGTLSAIEGCDAFVDLCANTKVKPWFDAVKEAIGSSAGTSITNL